MIKLSINFDSVSLQSNVHVEVALPYPNFVTPDISKCLVTLHCALKSGNHFFDELGIGYYVDRYNTAIISPDLGNSFFVDNNFQNAGCFLRDELFPYLQKSLPIPKEKKDTYCLGISMGAYGATNWALSNPDHFSKVFLLSGVYDFLLEKDPRLKLKREQRNLSRVVASLKNILIDDDNKYCKGSNIIELLDKYDVKADSTCFNLFCGDEDYLSLNQTQSFYEALQKKSLPSNITLLSGGHDNDFWKRAIQSVFESEDFNR